VNSKSIVQVGIAFILLGIVAFTYQRDTDNVGESAVVPVLLQAGVEARRAIPISYIAGGLVVIGGIVLVAVGVKKSPR
jgi:uncharacterized membrane protein